MAHRLGSLRRCFGCGSHTLCRHHGDAAGVQHGLGFQLCQHVAASGQCGLDDGFDGSRVGALMGLQSRRRFGQFRLVKPVVHQHGKRLHRLLGRVVVGDARVLEDLSRLGHRLVAQPAAHHPGRFAHLVAGQRHQRPRNVVTRHNGGRRVDEQHRAGGGIVIQHLQCIHVALHRRITNDVHRVAVRPVGRQYSIQLRLDGIAQFRQCHPDRRRRVRRHHARPAAIGQHRDGVAAVGAKARQRLGCQKQLLQRVDTQHTGAGDGCVKHHVRPRQRARVRGRRQLPLRRAPGFDDDHRLVARRRPRGRHELAWRLDRLRIQQNRPRVRIAGQVVEHVAKINVGMFTHGHKMRKPNAPPLRPVQHGGDQRARLRDKSQFPRLGVDV